jgi:hypothetical protein
MNKPWLSSNESGKSQKRKARVEYRLKIYENGPFLSGLVYRRGNSKNSLGQKNLGIKGSY